ncbi:hypothetical protein L2E82_26873 [Cichorium intybus]|uniref:Uncharacterized protein n=1 Tax=Cichorium intybus TaxID=13427 RepID=A0ACB9CRM7_CICIN|nr:hypothetical protein L2E82_26873 [Cichorium intybus]
MCGLHFPTTLVIVLSCALYNHEIGQKERAKEKDPKILSIVAITLMTYDIQSYKQWKKKRHVAPYSSSTEYKTNCRFHDL